MLQIGEQQKEVNGHDVTEVVKELRDRNEALRYLTRWRAARDSYQVQALRRSMHAITDGLTVSIPFRTGSWSTEPHLESHLLALAQALIDIPCLQVKLEGFADTRGSRRFNRKLSMRRVYAVWTVLARGGLPVERMRLKAHGDSGAMYLRGIAAAIPSTGVCSSASPSAECHDDALRAACRRLVVLGSGNHLRLSAFLRV